MSDWESTGGVRRYKMASDKPKRNYPPRLYPEGKSPLQKRSMHHNCNLSSFGLLKESIGEYVYEDIRDNSQVGVILKLADSGYVWWAKVVHHLLTHQLAIERRYEMWSLIEGSPIRFSLYEYEDITSLICDTIDLEDKVEVDHIDFWGDLKVDALVGPSWNELNQALRLCRTWTPEKRKMLGLLFVLHVGILGISRSSRIPLEYAKRVSDADAFERFPWGRVGFKSLIDSIKVVSFENNSYVIHGCVHMLLIWAFESLTHLGKTHGNKIEGDDVPLLSWSGGRPRISIADFLATERIKNKKVKVQHLAVRPEEEIYPVWPGEHAVYGEGECANELLDNLIHDIIHGCVDEKVWDGGPAHVAVKKKEKRKKKVEESEEKRKKKRERRKEKEESEDDLVEPFTPLPQKKPSDVVHLTDLGITRSSSTEFSDPLEAAQNKAFGAALDKLVNLCQKDDIVPRKARPKNLAPTQLHPFVGSSIVKRMLCGAKLSPAAYDPFEKVKPIRYQ